MSGNGSSSSSAEQPGSQETLAMAAMANGDPTAAHMMGDRNRNLLNKKMASSSSSYEAFGSPPYGSPGAGEEVLGHPTEEIPLAPTGEYKPTTCGTLTRREVYLWAGRAPRVSQRVAFKHNNKHSCLPTTITALEAFSHTFSKDFFVTAP